MNAQYFDNRNSAHIVIVCPYICELLILNVSVYNDVRFFWILIICLYVILLKAQRLFCCLEDYNQHPLYDHWPVITACSTQCGAASFQKCRTLNFIRHAHTEYDENSVAGVVKNAYGGIAPVRRQGIVFNMLVFVLSYACFHKFHCRRHTDFSSSVDPICALYTVHIYIYLGTYLLVMP